jgi:hypothetical protein
VAKGQYTRCRSWFGKRSLKAEVIRLLAQEGNKQALLDFITQQANTPEDVNILIPTHIENGDCQQARALLNVYDRSTTEKDNFFKLYDVLTSLCETGRGRAEISATERATLQDVEASETFVAVNAESMLAEVDQIGKIRVPERVGGFRGSVDNFIPNNNLENDLTIYPNPSEEQIVVSNSNKTNSEIIISDALGRVHFNGDLNEANLYHLTLSLNKGMYVVKQITEGGQITTKNILIQD